MASSRGDCGDAGRRPVAAAMDAPGKVTGAAAYAADFALPGMLHGGSCAAAEPHARLVRVDTIARGAAARRARVIAAADVPDVRYGGAREGRDGLRARPRALRRPAGGGGRRTTPGPPRPRRAGPIDVVYEPLPPSVRRGRRRSAPGAPLLHEAGPSYAALPILQRERQRVQPRAHRRRRRRARLRGGRSRLRAPLRARAVVHQGVHRAARRRRPVGQRGARSRCGRTRNCPFEVQSTLAEILQLPPSRVRVIVPGVGGGFGGKLRVGVEHVAALLARQGRPRR